MKYLTTYNPDWPDRFSQIATRLTACLPGDCTVHHVGSSSIPGMPAKDIIDLIVQCPVGSMPIMIEALEKSGYGHKGDQGLRGREVFRPKPGSDAATLYAHHLYACEARAHQLEKHLAFRDYLIAHPERASWLATQKIAVDIAAESREIYIEMKAACYSIITAESLEWAATIEHPDQKDETGLSLLTGARSALNHHAHQQGHD